MADENAWQISEGYILKCARGGAASGHYGVANYPGSGLMLLRLNNISRGPGPRPVCLPFCETAAAGSSPL